jgi:hydrogenase nickel incorporation protein HypA/HybF
VEPETLRFALETLSEDFEQLKGCRVEIETVEPTFHCDRCAEPFVAEGYFDPCPRCGGPGGALVGGDEMLLTSIEVEDA